MTRQIDSDKYAELVCEFLAAEDVHDRYRLRSLVTWHVPAPWYSWASFTNHRGAGSQNA